MQNQQKVNEDRKKVYAKDLDFGDFEETKIIKIRGHDITVLVNVPYKIQADIADIWIKYMTGIIDTRAKDRQMRDAFDVVLMHVVKSPILNVQFLRSEKCPPEFANLALRYVTDIWAELNDDGEEKTTEEDTDKNLDEVESPDLD